AEEAEEGGSRQGEDETSRYRERHRRLKELDRERGTIGAEPEIGGVAERDHAADAGEQVKARREQREDQHLGQDRECVCVEHGRRRRQPQSSRDNRSAAGGSERANRLRQVERRMRHEPLRPAEQAPGADDQHRRHEQEDQDDREVREEQKPEGVKLADQNRGEKSAQYVAHAADDGDDEHFRDDAEIHAEVRRLPRQLQGAAESGQHRAEAEDAGEELRLIDAESAGHLAVGGGGADQYAPTRPAERQPETDQHRRADRDQRYVPLGQTVPADTDGAFQAGRSRPEPVLRSPDRQGGIRDDQDHAEGGEELEELRRTIDPPQQQDLEQSAQQADREYREPDAGPEPDDA